jgi:hypothetical protein
VKCEAFANCTSCVNENKMLEIVAGGQGLRNFDQSLPHDCSAKMPWRAV